MSKPASIILAVILLGLVGLMLARLRFGGDEDAWLCENGQWVQHGHPSTSQPTSGCGPEAVNTESNVNASNVNTATGPQFTSSITTVSASEESAMLASGSWDEACPVPISDLRVLTLSYWNFEGLEQSGQLMVHADVAEDVERVFTALYDARFPIRRMELIDAFGSDDEASMLADNTSAFNCRLVSGSQEWSQHSYGIAVDINPLENPEVSEGRVDPPTGARYADRTLQLPGMIFQGESVAKAFSAIGWSWGGLWSAPKDYMHFSLNGT